MAKQKEAPAVNLAEMSEEELEKHIQALNEEKQALLEEMRLAHAELDYRIQTAEAARRIENLSEAEREAMRQYIEANPIPSEEAFGDLGGE